MQIDNTTAVSYINTQGGRKSGCNGIARDMWMWAHNRHLNVTATYLPGERNTEADKQSRTLHDNMEWKLDENMFKSLCTLWGKPTMDMFASRLNSQLPRYVSWKPDPQATHVDALTIDWADKGTLYMFPPFAMLSKILRKIHTEKAEAIMVAPLWPAQPWFSALLHMLTDDIFLLPRNVLTSHHKHQAPPQSLRLMAVRISGRECRNSEYLRGLRQSSKTHGGSPHNHSTKRTWQNGSDIQIRGVRIPTHPLRSC